MLAMRDVRPVRKCGSPDSPRFIYQLELVRVSLGRVDSRKEFAVQDDCPAGHVQLVVADGPSADHINLEVFVPR